MTDNYIIFPSLDIAPDLFFLGSDEAIEAAEAKEAERAAELEKVFFAPDFIAAEYITEHGAREILHHSTRAGIYFQLSYIAADGIPTMHENYINTGGDPQKVGAIETAAELLRHFTNHNSENPLLLHILTA